MPIDIASTAFEAGCNIMYDLGNLIGGEIDAMEFTGRAVVHTGKAVTKGVTTYCGAEAGAEIGTFLGPVGALVGGILGGIFGYLFGSSIVG